MEHAHNKDFIRRYLDLEAEVRKLRGHAHPGYTWAIAEEVSDHTYPGFFASKDYTVTDVLAFSSSGGCVATILVNGTDPGEFTAFAIEPSPNTYSGHLDIETFDYVQVLIFDSDATDVTVTLLVA